MESGDIKRYNIAAITLHWVMAIGFLIMIGMGLYMVHFTTDKFLQFQMYQWHKSLGVLLLLAFFLRILIRFLSKKPELPRSISHLEQLASKLGHWSLYLWMVILPLSGWLMVSVSIFSIPTIIFGWFEWPHLPFVETNAELEAYAKFAHQWLAYGFIALISVHVGAVVKHYVFEGENLLPRMGIGRVKKEI